MLDRPSVLSPVAAQTLLAFLRVQEELSYGRDWRSHPHGSRG